MPEVKHEIVSKNPSSALIAKWLDLVDIQGPRIPTQVLTDEIRPHPLNHSVLDFENHQLNIQLGVVASDLLTNPRYFEPEKADALIQILSDQNYLKKASFVAFQKLKNKQEGYLMKGESWQFAKVGLEVSPQSQQIAYKLHALQELLEPFAGSGATEYEDQLSDIFTREILARADHFKLLARAIGPYPFSVRWMDFLPGAENPKLYEWIKNLQLTVQAQEIPEILLSITAAQSEVTPETTLQILERKTFRSTGKVPPLRSSDVADPHRHNNKVELYLPLMGPGILKVKFADGKFYQFTPDPNMPESLDLSSLGAIMINGEPVLMYKGKQYKREGYYINVPLEDGKVMQWIVVMPGDIHDYQNVGISPASAFALTLGFPKSPDVSIEGDFIPDKFTT